MPSLRVADEGDRRVATVSTRVEASPHASGALARTGVPEQQTSRAAAEGALAGPGAASPRHLVHFAHQQLLSEGSEDNHPKGDPGRPGWVRRQAQAAVSRQRRGCGQRSAPAAACAPPAAQLRQQADAAMSLPCRHRQAWGGLRGTHSGRCGAPTGSVQRPPSGAQSLLRWTARRRA